MKNNVAEFNILVSHGTIPHSRACEKTGTSKGLWDRLSRRMDIAPTNKCTFFGIFSG